MLESVTDLQDEPNEVKRIALEKPAYWEFLLASTLLNNKLSPINKSFKQLESDSIVQRKRHVTFRELFQFVRSSLATFQSLAKQFMSCLDEISVAFGPPGQPGNVLEIKNAVDHMIQICKELLAWEYELNAQIPPEGLEVVKSLMRGWSKIFVDEINTIAPQAMQMVTDDKVGIKPTPISLTIRAPEGMEGIIQPFQKYMLDNNITESLI